MRSLKLAATAALLLALGLPAAILLAQDQKNDGDKPDEKKDEKPADPKTGDKPADTGTKDEGRNTKLPVSPFAKAKPGDWVTMVAHVHMENIPPEFANLNVYSTWTVVGTAEGKLKVKAVQKAPGRMPTEQEKEISTDEMTLGRYMAIFGVPDEAKLSQVKVEDEKRTFGDKEFACKKISFEGGSDKRKAQEAIWICAEVRCGFVAHEITGPIEEPSKKPGHTVKEEVLGYGTGDKTEWGKSPEEVSKVQNKEEAERGRK